MSVYSQDFYRGILLRDPRFSAATISTADTTATQASPTVDAPVSSSQNGTMDLQATGSSQPGASYDIRTIKPGTAWGEERGGRFVWRPTSEAAVSTKWRGWNPYSLITGTEAFKHLGSVGKAEIACWPDAVTTAEQRVHVVYSHIGSAITNHLYCKNLDPATDTWSEVAVDTSALGAPNTAAGPAAILELPGGRLLIIRQHYTNTDTVETFYSDDNGASWKQGSHSRTSPGILPSAIPSWSAADSSVVKIRAVYHHGYITMIRESRRTASPAPIREVDHYVSEDFGASWVLVERFHADGTVANTVTSNAKVHDPELVVDAAGTVLLVFSRNWELDNPSGAFANVTAYAKKGAPMARFADDPNFGSAGSPGVPIGMPAGLDGGTSGDNLGLMVSCVDPDGMLCLIAQGPLFCDAGTGAGYDFRSALVTLRYNIKNPGQVLNDTRTHEFGPFCMSDSAIAGSALPDRWPLLSIDGVASAPAPPGLLWYSKSCVTPYKDRLLLISGSPYDISSGQSDAADTSLRLIQLGGASNYDHQFGHVWDVNATTHTRPGFTYLPFETPPDLVAGVAGLSAFSVVGSMAFDIQSEGLRMVSTSDAYALRISGKSTWARVRSETAASEVGGEINGSYVSVRANGVEVRIGSGKAQVWDITGTPAALSAVMTLSAGMRDWFVSTRSTASGDFAWVAYKLPNENTWTLATYTGTGQLGAATTGLSEWGQPPTASVTSHWQMVQTFSAAMPDIDWESATYHPDEMHGRCFSVYPTYVDGGWEVESRGGPAFRADDWTMSTRYEFPISTIHPEIAATPRVGWRSLNDDAEQIISWAPSGTTDTRQLSPVIGIHLSGINFRTAHLEGWNGSAWVAVAAIDAGADFSGLKFSRSGDVIAPQATGTYAARRYVQFEELKDSYAVFDPGGGSEAVRKITHNSEGGWANPATPKSAELHLDGDASTLPASGNLEIRESAVTTIAYDATAIYDKYRLRIPVQQTAEGYFKIGACIIGPVAYFGQDYSWGRSMSMAPNTEIITGRSGDRLVEELGPERRAVEFAWAEGWDATKISGTSPSGYDHITASSSNAVAVRQDPTLIEGLIRRTRGAAEPVVYLPRVPPNPNTSVQILGRERHLYGRIVGQVTREAILGDEAVDEVQTINAITIEEEI